MGVTALLRSSSAVIVLMGIFALISDVYGYHNPVLIGPHETPDPGVMWDPKSHQYLMVHTAGYNIPIWCSPNLVSWTKCGQVFSDSTFPTWGQHVWWAPELHYVKGLSHPYVLLHSTNSTRLGNMRIGIAFAKDPIKGPWKDLGHQLVTMPASEIENIDATLFRDPKTKKPYLIWKTRSHTGTRIWGQELSKNLRSFKPKSPRRRLIKNDLAWEGWTVEGPSVYYHKPSGYYYLFYSGNTCCSGLASKYQVGVARSRSPIGKYQKHGAAILGPSSRFAGPGHGTVLASHANPKKVMMVYHAFIKGPSNAQYPGRYLMVDRVLFGGKGKKTWPYFKGRKPSSS